MDNIKDIINKVIGDMADHNPDTYSKAERIWWNLLNEQEHKHTKFLGVNKGTVSVCVDSPAWLYQMRMRKTKILKQLKEEIPDIKFISFKIGSIQ